MTRLGTPYSQCLGPDYRPQDPICPPGTNRYGSGFFDCSGFVSHAYRSIGIVVPATTYAMEADPTFMATKVSDRIDLKVMQPGDVFLMDGHTGMYVGGGMIVHAIGRGLTYEPVPSWVANGTIAVLRPIDLLGPLTRRPPPVSSGHEPSGAFGVAAHAGRPRRAVRRPTTSTGPAATSARCDGCGRSASSAGWRSPSGSWCSRSAPGWSTASGLDGWVAQLLVVFAALELARLVVDVPLDAWVDLRHDRRWGLSNQTGRGLAADEAKSVLLSFVLGAVLLVPVYALVRSTDVVVAVGLAARRRRSRSWPGCCSRC